MNESTGRSEMLDLLVRGGTLVIPGVGQIKADVGIAHGKIVALGENLTQPAAETYDATGRTVLPGIFDPHTHIGNEQSYESEAETETRAAILGGVTTIGIFLRSLEDSYFDHLPAFQKAMDERSYVDSVFHPQIFTEQQIEEIPGYAEQFGIRSFKFYMSGMPGIVKSVTDDVLLNGFKKVASLGPDAVVCVHCETGALIDRARQELANPQAARNAGRLGRRASGGGGGARDPDCGLSGQARDAHLYVVHLSSHQGLEVVRAARRQGARFTVETTTPYLGINSSDPNGFLVKMVPPVRTPEHQTALWEGFLEGSINTVGTDNTSRGRASKRPEAGLHGVASRSAGARHASAGAAALRPAARHSAGCPGRARHAQPGTRLRHLSAERHDRDRLRRRPGRRRPRSRTRRARRRPARHVGLLAVRRQEAARLAGRDHQGRQDHRARRQDRRRGQWPLPASQARTRPAFRMVRPGRVVDGIRCCNRRTGRPLVCIAMLI